MIFKRTSSQSPTVDMPPGSVAVVVDFYAGLFGGPLFQLLKCLAAIKSCAEFEKNGDAAVPVCLVRDDAPPGFSQDEINLIDSRSKLHCLKLTGREKEASEAMTDGGGFEKLFEKIEKIFPDGDAEALAAMKEAFARNTNSVSSCARWLKYLLKDFSVVIVEYDAFSENKNSGGYEPGIACRCPDATISNVRNLKTLKRYGLDFARLFDGKERVMDYVRGTLKSDVSDRLQKLRDETAAVLGELETAAFAARGERSRRIRSSRAARIIYQLEKIQRHSLIALANKEKAAESRIYKACDFLAPFGRRQRDVLGGAQVPLSYGLAGLRALYERLDITTSNHQLIEMD